MELPLGFGVNGLKASVLNNNDGNGDMVNPSDLICSVPPCVFVSLRSSSDSSLTRCEIHPADNFVGCLFSFHHSILLKFWDISIPMADGGEAQCNAMMPFSIKMQKKAEIHSILFNIFFLFHFR